MQSTNGTQVNIFGQVYHIQGDQNPEYAREVAKLVDKKMNLIAAQVQSHDSFRVAVLAALHLADECLAAQRRLKDLETEVTAKSGELADLLDAVEAENSEETSEAFRAAG